MKSLLEQEFGNYQDDTAFCHQGHEAGAELEFGGHPGSTVAVCPVGKGDKGREHTSKW